MQSGAESLETLVIGAGISGLTYAHARGPEADLAVCEASSRPGGLVWTDRDSIPGSHFERGPEAIQAQAPATSALLSELGLPLVSSPREASRRYVVRDGVLHVVPAGPGSIMRTRLLSARGKLRLLCEPWRDSRRALDGSVADFARHRLGREVLDALVDPLIGGIHAGDPETLSMRACFPQVVEMVETRGSLLRGLRARRGAERQGLTRPGNGMGALGEALASSLGPRLRLGTPVERLEYESGSWIAHTPAGCLRAGRVVLALSAARAAELLRDCAPSIAEAAGQVVCERLVSLVMSYPRDRVAHPLDGFGYLVPGREGAVHLGTLFSSSIDPSICPPDSVLLRVLAGGARHPDLGQLSDGDLWPRVLREVAPLLGLEGEPMGRHVMRWPNALPRFDLGHMARLALIERELPAYRGLHLLGNWLYGIGLNALIASARALASRDD